MQKKKLNIPFIEKEIQNLFDNALPDFIERMKKLETKNKDEVILDDDHKDDGTNTLRVFLQFENKYYDVKSDFNDIYRKHQLLGDDGAQIDFDLKKDKFKQTVTKQSTNMYSDLHPGINNIPAPTTTIPIEKEDIKRIISMLYSLTTYEYTLSMEHNLSQKEYDERTVSIFKMINKLLRLL